MHFFSFFLFIIIIIIIIFNPDKLRMYVFLHSRVMHSFQD